MFVCPRAGSVSGCSVCDLTHLHCSGNMQALCPSGVGEQPKARLPMWCPAVEQGRYDQLSDGRPLSRNAFSCTSVGGRVCIPRFSKSEVNVKDNASHGQVSSSSEWWFWWMRVKHKKLFLWKSQWDVFCAVQSCVGAERLVLIWLGEGCIGFVLLFYIPLKSYLLAGKILKCNVADLPCDFSTETIWKLQSGILLPRSTDTCCASVDN